MDRINSIEALEAIYDRPQARALGKVVDRLTPLYRKWIAGSRFCVLSTVGPEGTDASPRGDDGPVAEIVDDRTVRLPDWRGNNRLDSLRNIVRDGRASIMFMIPGSPNVVRLNGHAMLLTDASILSRFDRNGTQPKCVIEIVVGEVYFQCAKAVMRSGLWTLGNDVEDLPTAGDFVKERDAGFDAESYDAGYADYARDRMW